MKTLKKFMVRALCASMLLAGTAECAFIPLLPVIAPAVAAKGAAVVSMGAGAVTWLSQHYNKFIFRNWQLDIIDPQIDFLNTQEAQQIREQAGYSGLGVRGADDQYLTAVQKFSRLALWFMPRTISMDWHNRNSTTYTSNHKDLEGKQLADGIHVHTDGTTTWFQHCEKFTLGAMPKIDLHFSKLAQYRVARFVLPWLAQSDTVLIKGENPDDESYGIGETTKKKPNMMYNILQRAADTTHLFDAIRVAQRTGQNVADWLRGSQRNNRLGIGLAFDFCVGTSEEQIQALNEKERKKEIDRKSDEEFKGKVKIQDFYSHVIVNLTRSIAHIDCATEADVKEKFSKESEAIQGKEIFLWKAAVAKYKALKDTGKLRLYYDESAHDGSDKRDYITFANTVGIPLVSVKSMRNLAKFSDGIVPTSVKYLGKHKYGEDGIIAERTSNEIYLDSLGTWGRMKVYLSQKWKSEKK